MSVVIDVGGALVRSATKAPQITPFFAVANIRAAPFPNPPTPRPLSTGRAAALPVPKRMVPLGLMLSDVALASFAGPPPPDPKISTPTRIGASVVLVQEKNVPRPPSSSTPG